jgi:hypothetical protein
VNVKQYTPGTKISEPGCYEGLPIELYHGDCTDGPGISSSGLRTIESKTPLHYWMNSYLNPDRLPPEPKDHFAFGQAAHTLLLSENGFREKFVVRPDQWKDWRKDAAKVWRDEQQANGKTVLVPEDLKVIRHIANQLAADPLVASGILHGAIEHSMLWKDTKTGVWLRARPDVIPSADGVLVDLKTTTDASPEAVQRTVLNFGYAMQGSLAGLGMEATLGTKMTDFVLVWMEKKPPYAVRVSPVDPEWLYWGQRQLLRAINTFARCVETNTWPGYEGEAAIHMPQWLRSRFEDEDKHGLIPEVEAAA